MKVTHTFAMRSIPYVKDGQNAPSTYGYTLYTMVFFVILLIARTPRIACADRLTDTHKRQLL